VRFIGDIGQLIPILVVAFVVAAGIAFVLTPIVRRVAVRRGFIDRPGGRRVNTRPVPRAGGLAIAAAFLVVAAGVVALDAVVGLTRVRNTVDSGEIVALLAGGALAAGLGFLDDAFQLRARWQLLGQVALAAGAVALGISVPFVNNPIGSGVIQFFDPVAAGFTLFWIVGMINSINFIDGLDGLSSGIGVIAAVTLGIISVTTSSTPFGQPLVSVLCFALAGALVGFLRWNFHPATIFAGTSGTQFLGYTLAVLATLGSAKVALALLVLGIPIIDTFWIIVRRILARRAPFSPDRGHIHHRLLDLGISHRQAVLLIYVICAALAVLSLVLSGTGQLYAFLGLALVFGLALLGLTYGASSDALEADTYEHGERHAVAASGDDRDGPTGDVAAVQIGRVASAAPAQKESTPPRDDEWRARTTRSKPIG